MRRGRGRRADRGKIILKGPQSEKSHVFLLKWHTERKKKQRDEERYEGVRKLKSPNYTAVLREKGRVPKERQIRS